MKPIDTKEMVPTKKPVDVRADKPEDLDQFLKDMEGTKIN